MTKAAKVWNEADSAHFVSFCIELTANLAKEMAAEGKCDQQLYDSLKAMQLIVDLELRSMKKEGVGINVTKNLPELPDKFE